MLLSPFTFYRGAAKIMAADLAGTPTAGPEERLVRMGAPGSVLAHDIGIGCLGSSE
jgi:uncharacterized protein (DUF2252 family)